jgi:hypothetical protein
MHTNKRDVISWGLNEGELSTSLQILRCICVLRSEALAVVGGQIGKCYGEN